MGDLGFDSLKEQVKFRAGMDTSIEKIGSSSTNYYGVLVNHAYRQICEHDRLFGINRKFYIPELETSATATTTDGTAYVSTPSGVLVVRSVYDTTNNVKLTQIPWKVYISYTDRTNTSAEGDATEWCRSGARIYLHPTPQTTGDTMTIYYKKIVDNLSGTDTTIISSAWDEPIILLATYKGMTWQRDFEKAKLVKEELIDHLSGLVTIYENEYADRDMQFGPDSSYLPLR